MKKKLFLLFTCLTFLIMSMVGCGNIGSSENNDWPETGLGSMLPKPDAKNIHIGYNLDDSFSADIEKAKEEDFTSYVAKCVESGFTIDSESDSNEYTAYNEDGYRVSVSFYDSLKSISIILRTPKVNGTFTWPTIGLATLLPTPKTNVGTINIDTSIQFNAWIGETSFDDYNTYVNQCIESGFNVGYSNSEKVFSADNADGVSLRLEYQGFDTMYISMYAPDETENGTEDIESTETIESVESQDTFEPKETLEQENATHSEENEESENDDNTDLVDGMRPEFKEAMDSYELFFNEYCDFMETYAESPDDLSLLTDYAEYMAQYADTMSKMESLDDGEMNDVETKYYIEVTGRINQRLLEVSIAIQ